MKTKTPSWVKTLPKNNVVVCLSCGRLFVITKHGLAVGPRVPPYLKLLDELKPSARCVCGYRLDHPHDWPPDSLRDSPTVTLFVLTQELELRRETTLDN